MNPYKPFRTFMNFHKKQIIRIFSAVITFCTIYALIIPAITQSKQTFCQLEEHLHDESCYIQIPAETLPEPEIPVPFDQDISPENQAGDDPFDDPQTTAKTRPDTEESDSTLDESILICAIPEHTHCLQCFSNPEADIETPQDWEQSIPPYANSLSTQQKLLNAAQSQIGIKASSANFLAVNESTKKFRNRYGAFSGNPYDDAPSNFCSFVLWYSLYTDFQNLPDDQIYPLSIQNGMPNLPLNPGCLLIESKETEPYQYSLTPIGIIQSFSETRPEMITWFHQEVQVLPVPDGDYCIWQENLPVSDIESDIKNEQDPAIDEKHENPNQQETDLFEPMDPAEFYENDSNEPDSGSSSLSAEEDPDSSTEPSPEVPDTNQTSLTEDSKDSAVSLLPSEDSSGQKNQQIQIDNILQAEASISIEPENRISSHTESKDSSNSETYFRKVEVYHLPSPAQPSVPYANDVKSPVPILFSDQIKNDPDEYEPAAPDIPVDRENTIKTWIRKSRQTDSQNTLGVYNGTVEYRKNNSDEWKELSENTSLTLDVNGQIRFAYDYKIPAGTLTEANPLVFQLPEHLNIKEEILDQAVMDGNIQTGTFSISTDGLVTFTFNSTYVSVNEFSSISGRFSFSSSIQQIKEDNNGEVNILVYKEKEYQLQFKDTSRDLLVHKTIDEENGNKKIDSKTGTITYKIEIYSENGTNNHPVTLQDIMNQIALDPDIQTDAIEVYRYSPNNPDTGTKITPNFQTAPSGHVFQGSLPALCAGESYILYCKAKLTESLYQSVTATNTITVSSAASDGMPVSATDSVSHTFKQDLLKKNGNILPADPADDLPKVEWSIELNQQKNTINLTDCELFDTLDNLQLTENDDRILTFHVYENETELSGIHSIQDFNAYIGQEGNNPTSSSFKIFYTSHLKNGNSANHISLYKGRTKIVSDTKHVSDGTPSTSTGSSNKPNGKYLSKHANEFYYDKDEGVFVLKWKISMELQKLAHAIQTAKPGTHSILFEESLDGYPWHHYTKEQILDFINALNSQLPENVHAELEYAWKLKNHTSTGSNQLTAEQFAQSDEDSWYWKFTFNLIESENGFQNIMKPVELEYSTHAALDVEEKELKNSFTCKTAVSDSANDSQKPLRDYPILSKYDTSDSTKKLSSTEHTIPEGDTDPNARNISWIVEISIPREHFESGRMEDLLLTEQIPDGLELTDMKLYFREIRKDRYVSLYDPDKMDAVSPVTWGSKSAWKITSEMNQNEQFSIHIPKEVIAEGTTHNANHSKAKLLLQMTCRIPDHAFTFPEKAMEKTLTFTNTASIRKDSTQEEYWNASQKQIVTLQQKKFVEKSLTDHTSETSGQNDTLQYQVVINDKEETLTTKGSHLKLTDILTYTAKKSDNINVELDPDSIAIEVTGDISQDDPRMQDGSFIARNGKTWLNLSRYGYTTETIRSSSGTQENKSDTVQKLIHFTIPDGYRLILTYTYKASGANDASVSLKNSIRLQYQDGTKWNDEHTFIIHAQKAQATASSSIKPLIIRKLDETNENILLPDAEFTLTEFTDDSNGKSETFVTNENGEYTILIKLNTLYVLHEDRAPAGYTAKEPDIYLDVLDDSVNKELFEQKLPDKQILFLNPGDKLPVKNRKNSSTTTLTIHKTWIAPKDQIPDSIQINLIQYKARSTQAFRPDNDKLEIYRVETFHKTIRITPDEQDNWTFTTEELPSTQDENGTLYYYAYRIEEQEIPFFQTVSGQNQIITRDTATLVNEYKGQSFELPESGGSGTKAILSMGAGCILLSLVIWFNHKHK